LLFSIFELIELVTRAQDRHPFTSTIAQYVAGEVFWPKIAVFAHKKLFFQFLNVFYNIFN